MLDIASKFTQNSEKKDFNFLSYLSVAFQDRKIYWLTWGLELLYFYYNNLKKYI